MAFGGFSDNKQQAPMAEINVTPMVDVMLVLLVIFIITSPLFTNAIKLELPKTEALASTPAAQTVAISINAQGQIYWNNALLDRAEMDQRLVAAANQSPQPELQLRADKETRYEVLAQVMAAAQARGLTKLGFVTEAGDVPAAASRPSQASHAPQTSQTSQAKQANTVTIEAAGK